MNGKRWLFIILGIIGVAWAAAGMLDIIVEYRYVTHPDSVGGSVRLGKEETAAKFMFPGLIHVFIGGVAVVGSVIGFARAKNQPKPSEEAGETQ